MGGFDIIVDADTIILILLGVLLICLVTIVRLRKALAQERRRQLVPVLAIEISPQKPGIFLKNEGACYAKDIRVGDITCVLDYDFKKSVTLKFDRVGFLKPAEVVRLEPRIFDGKYAIPPSEARHLHVRLCQSAFEASITCANIQNSPYTITLIKDTDGFYIKQILPDNG